VRCKLSQRISSSQAQELEKILDQLPSDKVEELFDFAHYLHQRYAPHPRRGSAEAILQTIEDVGPLEFEPGELDTLLESLAA
jgi:hypothetical protein